MHVCTIRQAKIRQKGVRNENEIQQSSVQGNKLTLKGHGHDFGKKSFF